jgi:hypothetical protein
MTQITAVNLNKLNTFDLYKHYAGLSHSLPLLTPESKQLVLAELEQVARIRSEKMDGIHYALTNHEQLIATGKEEKKLLDAAIKHHEAEVKGLRGILERLHQLGCIEDNKLIGKNYQFNISPLPELALEVSKPVEEWDNEDKEAYAMVEEVTTTTIVRSNNGKDILWSDEKIKHKHVPNPDAIRAAHENGQPLPSGVRLIKKYRISRKRILNKQLNQNVD